MIIVQPSVTLLWSTPDAERVIELAGRTCYKSEDRITEDSAPKFIAMICKKQHESVIEHASASFQIVTNRAIGNQLERHRIASYSQESTRYCNYSKAKFDREIRVIRPLFKHATSEPGWRRGVEAAEAAYFEALEAGEPPEIARDSLPLCLKTELVATMNLRSWRHVLSERLAPAADPQMRQLAELLRVALLQIAPTVFAEFADAGGVLADSPQGGKETA